MPDTTVSRIETVRAGELPRAARVGTLVKGMEAEARRVGSEHVELKHLATALYRTGGQGTSLFTGVLRTAKVNDLATLKDRLSLSDSSGGSDPSDVSELVGRVFSEAETIAGELGRSSVGSGEIFVGLIRVLDSEEAGPETKVLKGLLRSTNAAQALADIK